MIAAPYTKLLTSNVMVDMGAALIVTSLEAALAAGVPRDQLVFPVAGASAREQWLLSQRDDLSVSLAMRACARSLFGAPGTGAPEIEHLDLYSSSRARWSLPVTPSASTSLPTSAPRR